ncbi:unnamed protein product [Rhizoctonia solani]|uniref:SAM domain-containing protein n=1 Tax=Rhizoctonia solani TaxID=456999 RepID=A0A8H3GJB0_9AGAM|nr:unnamed protein product [Rhizoctonia solani]
MAVPTPNATPDALAAFLKFARAEYGINNEDYYQALAHNKIGPDVMGEVEVSTLEGYGVPQGDAIRLKRAARSWEENNEPARPFKIPKDASNSQDAPTNEPARSIPFTIAFNERPSPPPPGYERTDLERAGCPREGKKGNFCWQEIYPGEPGGYIFWADLPSPTLAPSDPLLAPMGTVQLRVAPDTFIDVLRAPRRDIAQSIEDNSLDILDRI